MTTRRKSLGDWGEGIAVEYLIARGYEIVARNARTPYGEIDVVARRGKETVMVEVKTRSSDAFGWPEEAVTPQKRDRLVAAGQSFLQEHDDLAGNWRIDVIAIERSTDGQAPRITHYENAVN